MYGTLRAQSTCTSISLNILCFSPAAFSAPPTESLPGKPVNVVMYQVRPHVDKQDPVSGELRCGEYLRTNATHESVLRHCGYYSGRQNADVF